MHQVVVGLVVQGQNSVIVGNDSVSLQGQLSSLGRIVLSLDLINQSVIIGVGMVNGPPGMECIRVKVIRMIMNMAMIMVPMRFRINLTITFSLFRVHGRRTGNGAPTAALWP